MSLKGAEWGDHCRMIIDMNDAPINDAGPTTLDQIRDFLSGTQGMDFAATRGDPSRYGFIEQVLARFAYRRLGNADRGLILRYLARTTGYSRQQLPRLVRKAYGFRTLKALEISLYHVLGKLPEPQLAHRFY